MAKPQEIRVLLFRTGETEWDRTGRIAGAADVPLSMGGFEAVRRGVSAAEGAAISTVFCGPDEASQTTAAELAKASGARIKVIDELGEIHLGLWEGLLKSELEGKCPKAYRQWIENPGSVQAPEGESLDEAQSRIMNALGRSLSKAKPDNGAVAFVLRPVAMALVGCSLGGVPTKNVWSMLESGPATQWRSLPRNLSRREQSRAKVGA
jgi:probable phosphoglycerate mutase